MKLQIYTNNEQLLPETSASFVSLPGGENVGNVLSAAQDVGQIGDIPYIGNVDANELTETGKFFVNMLSGDGYDVFAAHWPQQIYTKTLVEVSKCGEPGAEKFINQRIIHSGIEWVRSGNFGNWTPWTPISINVAQIDIYIAKDGDDANTGLDPAYPVATYDRAAQILSALEKSSLNSRMATLLFGPGEWGTISVAYYNCYIVIRSSTLKQTQYHDNLPKFDQIVIYNCYCNFTNIVTKLLNITSESIVSLADYNCINRLNLTGRSYAYVRCNYDIKQPPETNYGCIYAEYDSCLIISGYTVFNLRENITIDYFVYLNIISRAFIQNSTTFNTNGFTFTGGKLRMYQASMLITGELALDSSGLTAGIKKYFGTNAYLDNGANINGYIKGAGQIAIASMLGIENRDAYATLEDLDADEVTPALALEQAKLKAIDDLNTEAQFAIYGGFRFEYNGEEYFVQTSLFDQQNMTDLATLALAEPAETVVFSCKNESGENVDLELSSSEYLSVYKKCVHYRQEILRSCRDKKRNVHAAETEEEVKSSYMG